MRFETLPLPDAFRIVPEPYADERGFFARTYCEDTFSERGLMTGFRQSSVSFNLRRGTVRGMHFTAAPHTETKLVRCTRGAILDAIIDLRPNSPTYRHWAGCELTADNREALYIPAGFAHGFQTLCDDTEVLYMIDKPYVASAARGARWDDPAFDLTWPEPVTVIAERDRAFPDWTNPEA
ncbi:dTDP-4-dehydrorhamnose 3,5-epimerase [Methylobacterium sp. WL30]|uniref:dTDP-4-dehydrorhamnose 3,5-epimerase n=1 Tax=unclassified Methylobacterium TaxID=2615210 RepID=UPI0011CAEE7E|nr:MULTISPECIES: dTDP-4-dehydrorhamnose 3,5-epimerase [unclassified Methylobacterium]TXN40724.1 dTDP-4-dehydrorhamnose 3,5-epimerase [Methylobacterium sp. WL93]TXN49086.1 dTDP-4-dehydrorhamnose 3,5-epimerase [Methylobacterium sp. WL119]TXN64969.1 dTDP-4-dehydrorhamnose 3,5-epimerase [Methylobacterium sp. WL30]